jgi:nuclease S1
MHMPMHVGDNHDRGGNNTQVRFFDRCINMHALWDTGMIERVSRSEDVWLKELAGLATPESTVNASRGSVEDWATESLLAAREAYQDVARGVRIKPGAKLGCAYLEKNLPVARQRMYRAGVRLADVLNEAFVD